MNVAETIKIMGVVPVVVLNDAKDAAPLANALIEGGLPCAEITFRTAAAEESIRIMASEFPQMLVGAGTVLTIDQVERAVDAGAKFIVSPGFVPEIVDYCLEKNIPVFPGCITPSELALAVKKGIKIVKFSLFLPDFEKLPNILKSSSKRIFPINGISIIFPR